MDRNDICVQYTSGHAHDQFLVFGPKFLEGGMPRRAPGTSLSRHFFASLTTTKFCDQLFYQDLRDLALVFQGFRILHTAFLRRIPLFV